MKRAALVLVAVVCLAIAGCGTGVKKEAMYPTAVALRDAAVKSGYECPNWDDSDTTDNFDAGSCLGEARDQFRVYKTAADREADTDGIILGVQIAMVATRTNIVVLVAQNWVISGPAEDVTPLKKKLGGYFLDLSTVKMP